MWRRRWPVRKPISSYSSARADSMRFVRRSCIANPYASDCSSSGTQVDARDGLDRAAVVEKRAASGLRLHAHGEPTVSTVVLQQHHRHPSPAYLISLYLTNRSIGSA